MTLTTHQLNTLRHDLVSLATIEYDDVMAELLDHYASLTEQKMANGLAFDEASKWAWSDLGSGVGLQKIQDDYAKSITKQVGEEHLQILKSYFGWPAFLTTALAGMFIYMVVPMLSPRQLIGCVAVLIFTPTLVLLLGHMKSVDRRISTGKIIWEYMQQRGVIAVNLLQFALNGSGFFLDSGEQKRSFLLKYPSISIALIFLALLYTSSFIQLYRRKFYYQVA